MTCPVCNGSTQEVKGKTVRHFVKANILNEIKDDIYNICLDEVCEVVYFNENRNIIINEDNIKIPIWFKKDADPQYICYCNHVRRQDIEDAVIDKGACNMKDIIRITGAMKNGECEIKNPLGKCCGPIIQEIIDEALLKKEIAN